MDINSNNMAIDFQVGSPSRASNPTTKSFDFQSGNYTGGFEFASPDKQVDNPNTMQGQANIWENSPAGKAMTAGSKLFDSTGKFVGGAVLNASNMMVGTGQEGRDLQQSNQDLNTIDEHAVVRAHQMLQNGQTEQAKRLLNVVKSHGKQIDINDILPNSQQNNVEQITGGALGTAAELGAFATGGGGATVVGKAAEGATTAGKGAMAGLKAGAKAGALYGAAQGAGQAMQENQGAHGVLAGGIKGAVGGALVGGAGGAAIGGVGGAIAKGAEEKAAAEAGEATPKVIDQVTEMTKPVLSKNEQISALSAGRGESATMLQGAKITPEARDLARSEAVKGVIDPKADLVTNIKNVRSAIANESQQTIEGLKANDAIFNKNQFVAKLKAIEPDLEIQADPIVAKKYDLAQQKFLSFVDEQPKNLSGLLQARKNFDAWVEQKIPTIWDDVKSKALNTALRDMRVAANDFIAEKLPTNEASQAFRDSLKKQNLMYEARDNMAEKAVKSEVGKSKVAQFVKAHPTATKAAKIGATALIGGEAIRGASHLVGQ